MCIKFALRRNLIYPLQYIIWSFVREVVHMIINTIIKYEEPYILLPLMFLGEILGGAIIYCYERKIMKTKNEEKQEQYFMSIKLIKYDKDENDFFIPLDNNNKIIFLMFLIAFFDSVQFYLSTIALHFLKMMSISFCSRLLGISTISAFFFYVYALKLPVYKHHKISLFIIGICLIIIIITEYFFCSVNYHATSKRFITAVGCIMASQIFVSCKDSLEKYLFEYDFMDPFIVLYKISNVFKKIFFY